MHPSHALRTPQRPCLARAPVLSPLLCALALAGVVGSAAAATNWTDGQAATLVLGADNLTTAGGGAASATRFAGPTDICADAATGKVFVMAYNQHRILRFSSAEAVKNGGAAEAVFGQPDFTSVTSNNGGRSAQSLYYPMTCAIDAAGRLFVADHGNKRVLRFDNAATKPSFALADGVLGQADFTSMVTGTAANRLGSSYLYGIALGPGGALYVSDGNNKRVLRFDNAASKANGAAADGVLGAADLTTVGSGGVTASTFSTNIYGLTLDAAGNLYVSDAGNRRILRFDNAAAKANGAAADGVLGAPDMTTMGGGSPSSSTMTNNVYGIDVLADGALYAADFSYNRVLIFSDPAHKANGAAADHVLGQSDFTSTSSGLTATGLNSPLGLGYNAPAGYLMIPDYGSHRVVGHFSESLKPNAAPTASGVAISSATPAVGQQLTGSYTYADADNDSEGASTFVWKRGSTPIGGATALQYTPVADDAGQALTFCVTPVASAGTATGVQACSAPTAAVAVAPLNGACGAAAGQPTALLPATGLCSVGTPSAVASASGQYSWQCQGLNGGSATSCQAPWASAGGGNSATVVLQTGNNWQVNSASFSTTPPAPAPQGVSFPAGLLALNLSSGTQGSDATVTLQFTTPIPAGAVYMKYGPSPDGFNCQGTTACAQPHWYELPASRVDIAPNRLSATLTLTDGGLGDHDGVANQFIQDPGGFTVKAAPPVPAGAQAIPTLSEWGVLLLSALAAAFGLRAARRRA
jgi:sugar lactone lactonase YvrE